jgi:hypothetical protein
LQRCSLAALALAFGLSGPSVSEAQVEWAGYVSVEPRIFFDPPAFPEQTDQTFSFSAVAAPEFRYEWNEGDDRLTVTPFLRFDADDDERSHVDLREANWLHFADPWTLRVGLGRVFWGVTESRHLVDIVNQTDQAEDIDEEDKLGQPMIGVERYTEQGTFSVFLLPGFRERTFPADDARLRGALPIADDIAVYESGAEDNHTDIALRWEQALGPWDIGVSGFYGTGREPRLVPTFTAPGQEALVPHYDIIGQLGLDLQYTRDAWLLKLEAIRRSGQGSTFNALAAGFEYTLFDILGSNADVGLLTEYLYDGRNADAPAVALDDDIFFGGRLALNDVDDTMLLFGVIVDRNQHGTASFLEGQRRLWDRWRLEVELRWLSNVEDPALIGFRQDSFLTVRLARFF